MSDAPQPDPDLVQQPHENEEVPAQDVAAGADALQPESQGDEPIDAELGEDGQGDLLPEDEPGGSGDGPDDLRVSDGD